MMAGHLTIAGVAEAVMSAGLFTYLRRNEPALVGVSPQAQLESAPRSLWGALAAVLLLTPLGILASGAAWGEWAPKDFASAAGRAQIAAASGNAAAPQAAPSGLARLANLWTAPLPDYAPHFVKSTAFGYMLSAMFGVGLILMAAWLAQKWFVREDRSSEPGDTP
jgi:cobalt/nickel transport system permease protein